MYIKSILMENWKCFSNGKIEFPPMEDDKNVLLIGGKNGYGKTSLFEAIILGIYGREGLPLLARAPFDIQAVPKLQHSYNNFLSGALSKKALLDGKTSSSIELSFDDDVNGPVILKRVWHFTASGQHKAHDEEVRIFEGTNERPVISPPNEDKQDWLRNYIARKFMPYYLAAFFMFDGEQVQALATKDMSLQVRIGIEGLLGIPVLRELAKDLKTYSDDRRSRVGGTSDNTLLQLKQDLTQWEDEKQALEYELSEIQAELERLIARRDELTKKSSGIAQGSEAQLKERYEDLNRYKRAIEEKWENLHKHIIGKTSLALSGRDLRQETIRSLESEEVRERWEQGKSQGKVNLDKFVEKLSIQINSIQPELVDEQKSSLLIRVRETWDAMWYPPPKNCAKKYKHFYLVGHERKQVIEYLKELDGVSASNIIGIIDEIHQLEREKAKLESEIASLEGIGPWLDNLLKDLNSLSEEIEALNGNKIAKEREKEGLIGQITSKRQELARLAKQKDAAAPDLKRAENADRVTSLIYSVISEAVPSQINELSKAMTKAYKSMAHKTMVQKAAIDENCTVRLLSKNDKDIRDLAQSAGEQQIFAQALIAAVSEMSGRNFPIIIDTPLARLDDAHREGVLRYFSVRSGQTIFLSTDTEIVGSYFDLISERLSATYTLEHNEYDDFGDTKIIPGYFNHPGELEWN